MERVQSLMIISLEHGIRRTPWSCITLELELKNSLHVPKLSTNLISIYQVTKDLNCSINFYLTHCVFQDWTLGKMIGYAKEKNGLCYLEDPKLVKIGKLSLCAMEVQLKNLNDIWLHHYILGHPSFIFIFFKSFFLLTLKTLIQMNCIVQLVNLLSITILPILWVILDHPHPFNWYI